MKVFTRTTLAARIDLNPLLNIILNVASGAEAVCPALSSKATRGLIGKKLVNVKSPTIEQSPSITASPNKEEPRTATFPLNVVFLVLSV